MHLEFLQFELCICNFEKEKVPEILDFQHP